MLLTERDRQLNCLRELLAESARGSGRIAIVSGPVGTGKTALLHVFSEYVTDFGGRSLTAVGSRAEQTVPLGLLRQLVQNIARSPELSDRIARLLNDGTRFLAHSEAASTTHGQIPHQVMDGLSAILLDLADQRPLFLGIDDMQYADEASLQSLLYFFRRLRSARVLAVLNEAVDSEPAHSPFRMECLSLPYCRRIRLAPISPDGVAEILDERLGERRGGKLAPAWHDASGGNPALILALLEDSEPPAGTAPEERPEEDLVVGKAYSQAMLNCLYRCEPRLLRVCQALAVAEEDGSPALVARVVGMKPEAASQAIVELDAAGLLDRGRFRHPAAVSAVRSNLSPGARAEMHLRVAQCLHDDGAPAPSIAKQLVAAGRITDGWGIPILQEAAEGLLSDDRVELAVACLELAHRSCADKEQQAIALSMLARAEWRVRPSVVGRYLPELVGAARAGHLRGRHAAALIRYLLWFGRVDEARGVLERLDGSGSDQSDKDMAAELRFSRLWMSCSHPALAADISPPANPTATKGISPLAVNAGMRAASVLRSILTHGPEGNCSVGAEKVLEGYRLADETAEALGIALFSLIYADRLDKANYWYNLLMKEAATRQAPWWQAMFAALRAEIAIRQGDLPSAKCHADAALTYVSAQSWGVAVGVPLATLVKASTAMGMYDVAAGHLDLPVTDAMFQTRFGLHYLHARGHYHLARGRFYAALDDFLTCGELMTSWRIDHPSLVAWRNDAAEGYLRLGKQAQAEKLINEQLSMLGGTCSRTRGISLRLLAAASESRRRPQLLIEAAEVLQECDDRFELARVFADMSQAYHVLGDMTRTRTMMRRAWHAAKECRAEMLCQELLPNLAKNNIDAPLVAPVSVDEIITLTSAERRVAVLAAQGRSNRDIAKELYVTVSTVEQHLTRVYRKLKVTRREGLPLRLLPSMADRNMSVTHD
jgi:DNA-binding CsgD family transcriptional regulator